MTDNSTWLPSDYKQRVALIAFRMIADMDPSQPYSSSVMQGIASMAIELIERNAERIDG